MEKKKGDILRESWRKRRSFRFEGKRKTEREREREKQRIDEKEDNGYFVEDQN